MLALKVTPHVGSGLDGDVDGDQSSFDVPAHVLGGCPKVEYLLDGGAELVLRIAQATIAGLGVVLLHFHTSLQRQPSAELLVLWPGDIGPNGERRDAVDA